MAQNNTQTALLVMVHGSPKPEANDQMYSVVDQVRERGVFPIVEVGFLECNDPTIAEAVDKCVQLGAQKLIAVPYFLHMGTHVADDLPSLIEDAQGRHPQVEFLIGDYLGASSAITCILGDRALTAGA